MPAATGPDFMCIGMMKTGTAWLFDQLQFHPDFWMPPIKEMHYLDRGDKIGRNADDILRAARESSRRLKRLTQRPLDERDMQFLEEMASHQSEPLDIGRYAALFRHKGDLKSGDVTPHYGSLSRSIIEDVGRQIPNTRAILLIRDPVARAWSHLAMRNRFDRFDADLLKDPIGFRAYLEGSNKLRRLSFPTEIVRRWEKHAPTIPIRFFFFDDIAERPQDARRNILRFLEADPDKPSGEISPDYNRKSAAKKPELSDDIKAVLVRHFAQELRDCAALFGGHAKNWALKYGV